MERSWIFSRFSNFTKLGSFLVHGLLYAVLKRYSLTSSPPFLPVAIEKETIMTSGFQLSLTMRDLELSL